MAEIGSGLPNQRESCEEKQHIETLRRTKNYFVRLQTISVFIQGLVIDTLQLG